MAYEPDTWSLGDRTFTSRFFLGSGKFNLDLGEAAVRDAGAEIVTLAVRRANTGQDGSILDAIPEGVTLLPNTSGARTADEAVRIARLARAMGCGDFVKVEVIRDAAYLMPDNAAAWELLQAGATQLRMSGMGGPVGFDYNALALVAEAFGIDLTPGMWRKVQAVETVIRRNAAKQAEKTQQASASTR